MLKPWDTKKSWGGGVAIGDSGTAKLGFAVERGHLGFVHGSGVGGGNLATAVFGRLIGFVECHYRVGACSNGSFGVGEPAVAVATPEHGDEFILRGESA